MLTSYLVACPHLGCGWSGSLLPCRDTDAWKYSTPTTAVAAFECPQCHGEWRARIVGDDVVPLPVDDRVAQLA